MTRTPNTIPSAGSTVYTVCKVAKFTNYNFYRGTDEIDRAYTGHIHCWSFRKPAIELHYATAAGDIDVGAARLGKAYAGADILPAASSHKSEGRLLRPRTKGWVQSKTHDFESEAGGAGGRSYQWQRSSARARCSSQCVDTSTGQVVAHFESNGWTAVKHLGKLTVAEGVPESLVHLLVLTWIAAEERELQVTAVIAAAVS